MSGSEQFLGQQLSKQANALESLVVKMSEMVYWQEGAVDKYAIPSDNLKKEMEKVSQTETKEHIINVTGKIRIVFKSQEKVDILVRDIIINENDRLMCYSTTNTAKIYVNGVERENIYLVGIAKIEYLKICFDVVPKPEII